MNKSVIITGNKGLIGRYLNDTLIKLNYSVIGFDKENDLQNEKNVEQIMKNNSEHFHLIHQCRLEFQIYWRRPMKTYALLH